MRAEEHFYECIYFKMPKNLWKHIGCQPISKGKFFLPNREISAEWKVRVKGN